MINFSFFINNSFAAPSTFAQTDWTGGQTANVANDTSNQTGWNEYSSKDTSIGTTTELVLQDGGGSVTQTSDTDFALGTDNNTDINGTGNSAAIEVLSASGEQIIDISQVLILQLMLQRQVVVCIVGVQIGMVMLEMVQQWKGIFQYKY